MTRRRSCNSQWNARWKNVALESKQCFNYSTYNHLGIELNFFVFVFVYIIYLNVYKYFWTLDSQRSEFAIEEWLLDIPPFLKFLQPAPPTLQRKSHPLSWLSRVIEKLFRPDGLQNYIKTAGLWGKFWTRGWDVTKPVGTLVKELSELRALFIIIIISYNLLLVIIIVIISLLSNYF